MARWDLNMEEECTRREDQVMVRTDGRRTREEVGQVAEDMEKRTSGVGMAKRTSGVVMVKRRRTAGGGELVESLERVAETAIGGVLVESLGRKNTTCGREFFIHITQLSFPRSTPPCRQLSNR